MGTVFSVSTFAICLFTTFGLNPDQVDQDAATAQERTQEDDQAGPPNAAPNANDSRFEITVDGKHGFINPQGKIVIPPTFEKVYPFSDGLAAVQINQRWGFIDAAGKMVIQPRFISVAPFSDGRARFRLNEYTDPWGYIDTAGQVAIEPKYDCADDFRNGIARVGMETTKSKLLGNIADVGTQCDERYIDKKGQPVQKPSAEHYATGKPNELIRFVENKLVGYVDARGKVIIKPQFVTGSEFSEGLACVCKDTLCGYIDRSGDFVIEPRYPYANDFSNGLAGVQLDGNKWGFIDDTGKPVLPAKYNWVYNGFRDGLAQVAVDGRIRYINMKGDWVW